MEDLVCFLGSCVSMLIAEAETPKAVVNSGCIDYTLRLKESLGIQSISTHIDAYCEFPEFPFYSHCPDKLTLTGI